MPIDTDTVVQESFEVLDSIDIAPPGSDVEQYVESGETQLTLGQQVVTVTFGTEKASSSYVFDETEIVNTVDTTPYVISFNITDVQTTGFEVLLSTTPDTGNYYFRWKVRIPTALVNNVSITAVSSGLGDGTVKHVSAVANDGLTASVTNATSMPTLTLGIADGSIELDKLAETVVTGTVLTPTGAATVTNKTIDGGQNTLTNIPLSALDASGGLIIGEIEDPLRPFVPIWDDDNGEFVAQGSPAHRGISKEVHLAIRTDSKDGLGTPEEPLDASTAVKFDTIMDGLSTNVRVVLQRGATFLTNGLKWPDDTKGWRVKDGMYVQGNGATIKLTAYPNTGVGAWSADVGNTLHQKHCVVGNRYYESAVSNVTIENVTIDANWQNLASPWTNKAVHCAFLFGSNNTYRNVHATNFYGNAASLTECFALAFNAPIGSGTGATGNMADSCWFDSPRGDYQAGICLFGDGSSRLIKRSVVTNCRTLARLETGLVNHAWDDGVLVKGCYTYDSRGVYHDTGNSNHLVVTDCVFDKIYAMGVGNQDNAATDVVVTNSYFNVSNGTAGISGHGISPSLVTGLFVSGNTFTKEATSGGDGWYALFSNTMVDATIADNCIGSGLSNLCSGTDVIRRHNRDENGQGLLALPDTDDLQIVTATGGTVTLNYGVETVRLDGTLIGPLVLINNRSDSFKQYRIIDPKGVVTSTNTVSVRRQGTSTINGGTADVVALSAPYGSALVMSDGLSPGSVQVIPYNTSAPSDAAFDSSWNGAVGVAPSKNSIWDALGKTAIPEFEGIGIYAVGSDHGTVDAILSVNADGFVNIRDSGGNLMLDGETGDIRATGNLTIDNAKNIVLGTTTGTKIGTVGGAAGQKLAFWNSTPIVQPVLATGAGATVDNVITTLQALGLVRQS